jgi:hypothetical protein
MEKSVIGLRAWTPLRPDVRPAQLALAGGAVHWPFALARP